MYDFSGWKVPSNEGNRDMSKVANALQISDALFIRLKLKSLCIREQQAEEVTPHPHLMLCLVF